MPYTPPVASPSASPCSSRSGSFSNHDSRGRSMLNLLDACNPPRSTTYLHRHRRSSSGTLPPPPAPIVQTFSSTFSLKDQPPSSAVLSPEMDIRSSGSVRQSPPPVDDGLSVMPNGAVISPPDSTQNSSDEDDCSEMRTARELGGPLEEQLKEAIMKIPQRRFPSPERKSPPPIDTSRGRNVTAHHRSRSDSSMLIDIASRTRSGSNSGSVSDFEDDAYRLAPAMIRKKSGEVVKSSLKSPCRSRPCSMPSTPTFPKNVHFDSRIEHVRHFLHSEKPSAVSVGSSPVEGVYDTESEYPFESDEPQWDIVLPNFPKEHESRKALAVRLEKVCLSTDKKNLIGTIAVSNLSFQKHVVTRFTFDYWQTVSEVGAEYSSDVRRKEREDGVDRFVFKIKLAEQANLEKKVLFFCIRYTASGQEHWDNNAGVNFQVDFKRAEKAQRCQQALPRSKPTPLSTRPRSLPTMEDYDELMDKAFFGNSKRMGASERPKPKASSRNLAVEEDATILARRANPTSNAFGNRYSLTAAIKAADTRAPQPAQQPRTELKATETSYFNLSSEAMSPMESPSIGGSGPPEIFATGEFWTVEDSSKPWTSEDKPSIESPSYRELLDNYCFFGSSKATKGTAKPEAKKEAPVEKMKAKTTVQLLLPSAIERPSSPQYTTRAPHTNGAGFSTPPMMSVSQQKSSGNASPIPLNYAGFHHKRRGSGAFRFETKTPTAIC